MNYDHEYFDKDDGQITKVTDKQRKFFANASFLGHLKPTLRNTNKAMDAGAADQEMYACFGSS